MSASVIHSLGLVSFPKENDSIPNLCGGGRVEWMSGRAANPLGTQMWISAFSIHLTSAGFSAWSPCPQWTQVQNLSGLMFLRSRPQPSARAGTE